MNNRCEMLNVSLKQPQLFRTSKASALRVHSAGFTLVEMIVSITLVGLLAVVAVPLVRTPMTAYMDAAQRADLAAEMDATVTKMRDDLAEALPNSIRIRQVGTNFFLEYLPVRATGRMRTAAPTVAIPLQCPTTCSAAGANDAFEFSTCNESCFTPLGPVLGSPPQPGNWVVVNALSATGGLGQNPYFGDTATPAGGVKSGLLTFTPAASNRITMTPHRFPAMPANKQFYVVGNPVTYECNPTTGRITRYEGYAIAAVQPITFAAATSVAPLATLLGACTMVYTPTGAAGAGRGGLVSVWLQFSRPSAGTGSPESVESFSEISVREPA
jgi:MSHA biogenesis protein MshO